MNPEEAVHEARVPEAAQRHQADEDLGSFEDPSWPDEVRPLPQPVDVVNDLRPHHVPTGIELRFELRGVVRIRQGDVGDADQIPRRVRDLGARPRRPLVADPLRERDDLVGPQIEHRLRVGMIPDVHRVAAEHEQVPRAEGPPTQQVGRDRQSVPISADELERGLGAGLANEAGARQRRHVRRRNRIVGDVDGVDVAHQPPSRLANLRAVSGAGRHDLTGDDELAGLQECGETASLRAHPPYACVSAAVTVLTRSIATVMGPTPPGTGVMAPATSTASSKCTSPTRPPSVR